MKAQNNFISIAGFALQIPACRTLRVMAVLALSLMLSASAQASLVSNWVIGGGGGGTLTNVSAGNVTYGNTSGLSAIYSTLNGGAGYTLGVGDSISFSGTAQNTTGMVWGQNILREMLMYSATPTTATGWAGYFIGDSAPASASDFVAPFERRSTDTGNWYSGVGATMLPGTTQATGTGVSYSSTSLPSGTYGFSYTITRDSNGLQFSWSLVQTLNASGTSVSGVYSFTGTASDTSVSNYTFNQVGIMASSSAFTGTMSFNSLDVTYTAVPEPASVAMIAAGVMGLVWIQRSRKS